MRILFYIEPLVERENPVWKSGWLEHFVKEISAALIAEGHNESDLACIVPSALDGIARSVLPQSHVVSIDQTELIPRFGSSALAVASGWYLKNASSAALSGMSDFIRERLGNFTPTLCVTFSPAPFLKLAWPEVKVLHMEYGFISRPPFPETVYFDPRGMFAESVLATYKDDLASWCPPEEAIALLSDLRQKFGSPKDVKGNPVAGIVSRAIEPFESAVLLALQFSNFYAYDANARFPDQYDLLVHTLDSLPRTVAVVVCEHPEHLVLKPETVEYLIGRYPNFIWHPMFRQVYGVSHYLMPFVQGVITVSSSVGLQALLWKKHLAVVGGGHLAAIADTQDPGALPEFLGTIWDEQRDRILCWLLSNQHLPFRYLLNSGRLRKYLQTLSDESPVAVETARLTAGLSLDEIRSAYNAAWEDRPITAYGTAFSADPNNFFAALYVATESRGYDEAHCIREFVSFTDSPEASICFLLDGENASPVALRFDPANRPGAIWLSSITLADENGKTLWVWGGEESGVRNCRGLELIPQVGKALAVCYDNDPQFELVIDFMSLAASQSHFVLSVDMVQCTPKEAAETLGNTLTGLIEAGAEKNSRIAGLLDVVADSDSEIASLTQALSVTGTQLEQVLASTSWQITKPLRFARRVAASGNYAVPRRALSDNGRALWRALPLSYESKRRLKGGLFNALPWAFRWSKAYQTWDAFGNNVNDSPVINPSAAAHSGEAICEYVPLIAAPPLQQKPVKLICFYLPQFHPIPENDEWWGEGFTEWTYVQPAQPQFEGHYQPHVPGELGYYNLLDPGVQRRQIELAKLYGIEGFCFYFYWFGGKRLLEAPVENYLNDDNLDLPFCLCWANENWSRRWDGLDSEILISQHHSAEDDLAFIEHISKYLKDSRYIRVEGKPLLLVYRPSLLPSAKETASRWRDWCRANDIGEIYIAYTQSFDAVDPAHFGFDAAIEFPPNNMAPPLITKDVSNRSPAFTGHIYDWRVFPKRSEIYQKPEYTLFRGVNPSWDNTARKKTNGTILYESSPLAYQHWLKNAIVDTVDRFPRHDSRLVFINAWNEWAEGAHLEPDQRYGYAYLQATRNALEAETADGRRRVLLVTHDCHPHGAQFLALEVTRQLVRDGFIPAIIALEGGKLQAEFARLGSMLLVSAASKSALHDFLANYRSLGCSDVITSTVVCGSLLPDLKKHGFRVLSLIHELPGVIHGMKQEENAKRISKLADKVVFPAQLVCDQFATIAPVAKEKSVIRPQGLLRKNPFQGKNEEAHRVVCQRHELPQDSRIVLNIGYLDQRKGADLFVEIAAQVCENQKDVAFIWVGHAEQELERKVRDRIDELGLKNRIVLVGFDPEPLVYYAAASVYALTSREDPFPNVVLESVSVGVPVVAFEGTTGAADFIIQQGGLLARHLDVAHFAAQLEVLLSKQVASSRYSLPDLSLQRYLLDLLHHLNGKARVSVIVPNFNYGHLIERRLNSIHSQSHPIYELIVLDDASSDDSVAEIEKYFSKSGREAKILVNESNSGSVFRQWVKGAQLATGDLVWIAEADDIADPDFLASLVPAFGESETVLAFCQSRQIDEKGRVLANDYLAYTSDISERWRKDHFGDGMDEIRESLSIKNVIPNASGVLFKRQALLQALEIIGEELFDYHVAGDWLVYLHVLAQGRLYYSAASLNDHRRHQQSVTSATGLENHLAEVAKAQSIAQGIALPDETVRVQAQQYLARLRKQFGLENISIDERQNA